MASVSAMTRREEGKERGVLPPPPPVRVVVCEMVRAALAGWDTE